MVLYSLARLGARPSEEWVTQHVAQLPEGFRGLGKQGLVELVAALAAWDWQGADDGWVRQYVATAAAVVPELSRWQAARLRVGVAVLAPHAVGQLEGLGLRENGEGMGGLGAGGESRQRLLFSMSGEDEDGEEEEEVEEGDESVRGSLQQQQEPPLPQQQQQQKEEEEQQERAWLVFHARWAAQVAEYVRSHLADFSAAEAAAVVQGCKSLGATAAAKQLLLGVVGMAVASEAWVGGIGVKELQLLLEESREQGLAAAQVQKLLKVALQQQVEQYMWHQERYKQQLKQRHEQEGEGDVVDEEWQQQLRGMGEGAWEEGSEMVEMEKRPSHVELAGVLYQIARLQQHYLKQAGGSLSDRGLVKRQRVQR
jgi:N-acetylglutamate synthase-like GNAT family acetyltransferase